MIVVHACVYVHNCTSKEKYDDASIYNHVGHINQSTPHAHAYNYTGDIFSLVLISAISANESKKSQKLVRANSWPPSCLMYPDRHFAKNYTRKM